MRPGHIWKWQETFSVGTADRRCAIASSESKPGKLLNILQCRILQASHFTAKNYPRQNISSVKVEKPVIREPQFGLQQHCARQEKTIIGLNLCCVFPFLSIRHFPAFLELRKSAGRFLGSFCFGGKRNKCLEEKPFQLQTLNCRRDTWYCDSRLGSVMGQITNQKPTQWGWQGGRKGRAQTWWTLLTIVIGLFL